MKNRLYAKDVTIFLDELIELGLVEKVLLPTCSTSGRGLIVISTGNRRLYSRDYYRLTSKGLEFLKEVDRNGGIEN